MAASLKAAQKMRLDYNVDREVYDNFVKACSHKGYAQNIVIEKLMRRFNETGQF